MRSYESDSTKSYEAFEKIVFPTVAKLFGWISFKSVEASNDPADKARDINDGVDLEIQTKKDGTIIVANRVQVDKRNWGTITITSNRGNGADCELPKRLAQISNGTNQINHVMHSYVNADTQELMGVYIMSAVDLYGYLTRNKYTMDSFYKCCGIRYRNIINDEGNTFSCVNAKEVLNDTIHRYDSLFVAAPGFWDSWLEEIEEDEEVRALYSEKFINKAKICKRISDELFSPEKR